MYALPHRYEEQYQYQPIELPVLIDPALLRAARQLYRIYQEFYTPIYQPPSGVVIHRFTYRGKLVYAPKPIILPDEYFVPLSHIESDVY